MRPRLRAQSSSSLSPSASTSPSASPTQSSSRFSSPSLTQPLGVATAAAQNVPDLTEPVADADAFYNSSLESESGRSSLAPPSSSSTVTNHARPQGLDTLRIYLAGFLSAFVLLSLGFHAPALMQWYHNDLPTVNSSNTTPNSSIFLVNHPYLPPHIVNLTTIDSPLDLYRPIVQIVQLRASFGESMLDICSDMHRCFLYKFGDLVKETSKNVWSLFHLMQPNEIPSPGKYSNSAAAKPFSPSSTLYELLERYYLVDEHIDRRLFNIQGLWNDVQSPALSVVDRAHRNFPNFYRMMQTMSRDDPNYDPDYAEIISLYGAGRFDYTSIDYLETCRPRLCHPPGNIDTNAKSSKPAKTTVKTDRGSDYPDYNDDQWNDIFAAMPAPPSWLPKDWHFACDPGFANMFTSMDDETNAARIHGYLHGWAADVSSRRYAALGSPSVVDLDDEPLFPNDQHPFAEADDVKDEMLLFESPLFALTRHMYELSIVTDELLLFLSTHEVFRQLPVLRDGNNTCECPDPIPERPYRSCDETQQQPTPTSTVISSEPTTVRDYIKSFLFGKTTDSDQEPDKRYDLFPDDDDFYERICERKEWYGDNAYKDKCVHACMVADERRKIEVKTQRLAEFHRNITSHLRGLGHASAAMALSCVLIDDLREFVARLLENEGWEAPYASAQREQAESNHDPLDGFKRENAYYDNGDDEDYYENEARSPPPPTTTIHVTRVRRTGDWAREIQGIHEAHTSLLPVVSRVAKKNQAAWAKLDAEREDC